MHAKHLVPVVPEEAHIYLLRCVFPLGIIIVNNCFLSLHFLISTLAEDNLLEITEYLQEMQNKDFYDLGVALELRQSKVKTMMDTDTFRDDVIAAWLRKEDCVKENPSWTVLINALKHRRVGQTGIANKIAEKKGLKKES